MKVLQSTFNFLPGRSKQIAFSCLLDRDHNIPFFYNFSPFLYLTGKLLDTVHVLLQLCCFARYFRTPKKVSNKRRGTEKKSSKISRRLKLLKSLINHASRISDLFISPGLLFSCILIVAPFFPQMHFFVQGDKSETLRM